MTARLRALRLSACLVGREAHSDATDWGDSAAQRAALEHSAAVHSLSFEYLTRPPHKAADKEWTLLWGARAVCRTCISGIFVAGGAVKGLGHPNSGVRAGRHQHAVAHERMQKRSPLRIASKKNIESEE